MSSHLYLGGCTWFSKGIPSGSTVAVDGSWRPRERTLGFAWLADTGAWYCAYRHLFKHAITGVEALHAELYGIHRAIERNPTVELVLCDSQIALAHVQGWQRGGTEHAPKSVWRNSIRELPAILAARPDIEFRWVPAHSGDPLNEGADALARLATRRTRDRLAIKTVKERAAGIAAAFAAEGEAA